jgi:hypothetical protein
MQPSSEVVAFLASTDLERSRVFFSSVLELEIEEVTPYACVARTGSTTLRFAGMDQDSDAVWTAPGGALVAWFNDPDGNVLSFTQF